MSNLNTDTYSVSDPNKLQINVPERDLPIEPMTMQDLDREIHRSIDTVSEEFSGGLEFIKKFHKSVTFFGSARSPQDDPYYQKAKELAIKLSNNGYAVVTGGGPGIMEGANRGAYEAGGPSLGLTIELPNEQVTNPFVTENFGFKYFFTRKVCLSFSAEAYVYFPGGFGTLDEFFEIMTLVQTKKIAKVPIILVGREYWIPLYEFIQKTMYEKFKAIDELDMELFNILDDTDTIVDLIKTAPIRFEG